MALLTDEDIAFYQASLIVCKSKCLDDLDLDKLIDGIRQLTCDLEAARAERDLAIAHDRQPYPTAEAYEAVCAALNKHKHDLAKAKAENEKENCAHAIYAAATGEKIDVQFKDICQLKRENERLLTALDNRAHDLAEAQQQVRDLDGALKNEKVAYEIVFRNQNGTIRERREENEKLKADLTKAKAEIEELRIDKKAAAYDREYFKAELGRFDGLREAALMVSQSFKRENERLTEALRSMRDLVHCNENCERESYGHFPYCAISKAEVLAAKV